MNRYSLKARAGSVAFAAALAWFLSPITAPAAQSNSPFSCVAYRFAPEENWRLRGGGGLGATSLEGRVLGFDFTQGAAAVGLSLPDRVLLGRPEKLRLRVRGSVRGHPVRVQLRTHFMSFA